MSSNRVIRLQSAAELLRHSEAWNDLWRRSTCSLPTAQAEPLAWWIEHFARRGSLLALVVEQDGRWVAALPLTGRGLKAVLPIWALPTNPWTPGGDLLLDPECSAQEALGALVAPMAQLGRPLIWLEGVNLDAPAWREFAMAAAAGGMACQVHPQFRVGEAALGTDFDAFFQRLSSDFRRNLRRRTKNLEQQGELSYRRYVGDPARDGRSLEDMLRRAFEVECRSWKADSGAAVLNEPGMFDFFLGQAARLAEKGQLAVCCLELDGEPIAFEYGYHAKGVYYAHKVSYDERYAAGAPPQTLRWRQMDEFAAAGLVVHIDYLGAISGAVERWTRQSYSCGRIALAAGPAGRCLLKTRERIVPLLQRWRERVRSRSSQEPTAADPKGAVLAEAKSPAAEAKEPDAVKTPASSAPTISAETAKAKAKPSAKRSTSEASATEASATSDRRRESSREENPLPAPPGLPIGAVTTPLAPGGPLPNRLDASGVSNFV